MTMKIFKKNLRIFTVFILPRGLARKNKVVFTIFSIIVLLFASIYIYNALHPGTTDAAWWNDDWGYRIIANVSNPGSALSDYQISITVDTATLITAGKMQSDCDDIRITDGNGNLINHWIETGGKGCNTSTTNIWVKAPSLPTSGSFLYVYYGNPSASNVQNGNTVFEFFDDFSGSSLDQSKWMTGTIGSTSGTDWSVSGGTLAGGNNNRYIQSVNTYSGDYAAYARSYTTTDNTNGFTTVGFWASTSNGFGILDHNNSSYYRNDGAWVNFAVDGTGQWTQNTVKVVGTNATYTRTGETSGSSTTTVTNSGISAEYLRFGARYDSNALNQNFTATWDWVFVKKAVATEPTVSPGSEEKAPAPAGYWKFDEGTGITAKDSSSKQLNGTITGATWQTEDNCVLGKCLFFNENSRVDINDKYDFPSNTPFTLQAWVRATDIDTVHWRRVISKEETDGNGRQGYTIYQNINTSNFVFDMFRDGAGSSVQLGNGALNTWTHIAVTYDGSTLRGYVNGRFTDDTSTSINVKDISADFAIGAYSSGSSYFKGAIDEVKIYPYASSAEQIKLDYNVQGAVVLGASTDKNLSNGLVGYWKMDESSWTNDCSTTSVTDSSGNGNNGAACPNSTGPTGDAVGKYGNAGSFDGSDDYVNLGTGSSLNASTVTVAAWVKPSGSQGGYDRIVEKSYSTSYYLGTDSTGTKFKGIFANSSAPYGTLESTTTLTSGTWYHVAITHDGVTDKLYVNGVLEANQANTAALNSSIAVAIGRQPTSASAYWAGTIDETRIYNRALSSAEVSQLYNFAPSPIGYWDFEDGQGTTVSDRSSKSNTGTWNGSGPHWTQGKYGKAGNFNGTDDYVSETNGPNLTSGDWTMQAWIKPTAFGAQWRHIFGSEAGTYAFGISSGSLMVTNNTVSDCTAASVTPSLNTWSHVAASFVDSSNTLTYYVNGKVANSVTCAASTTAGRLTKYIGRSLTYASAFSGQIDEVKVYNYARSTKQVVSDMNAGHPAGGSPVGSQVAYWKFDEGYGTVANDQTPKRNNGALNCQGGGCTLPAWTNNGKFGKALTFGGSVDANNNTVTITPTDANGLRNLGDVTISAWIKPSSSYLHTSQAVLRNGQGGDLEYSMYYNPVNQYPYFHWYDGAFKQVNGTSNSAPLNQWSHIVIVRQGTTVYFYVNGRFTNSAAVTAPTVNAGQLAIGRTNNAAVPQDYSGVIDELKVYNYALSADEVKIDYNRNASQVLGAVGTESDGIMASNSSDRGYCPPGDTTASCAPVGEWNFEEGQGTTANDTSVNGYSGTLANTYSWTQGKYGKGLKFINNGTVTVSGASGQLPSIMTVEAWVNYTGINTGGFNRVVARGWVGDGWLLGVYDSGGDERMMFGIAQGGVQYNASKTGVSPGKHHLAGVYDGTTTYLYLNGVLVGSNTGAPDAATLDTSSSIIVGANGNTNPMTVDEVRIYNYARTPAQIAWDYNQGKPIARWKMDECQGSTINDSSGNGLAGTITIGATGTQTSVGTCQTASTAWYNGAAGKFNYSLNFDGTDDYANMGNPSSLQITGSLALSAWIKTSETNQGGIVSKWYNTAGNRGYRFLTNNGTLSLNISSDGTANADCSIAAGINNGAWHHVVAVFDAASGTARIYKNGSLIKTCTGFPNAIYNPTQNFNIGTSDAGTAGGNTYTGQIDDVQLFNYALTPAQVKNLTNQGGAIRFGPANGTP